MFNLLDIAYPGRPYRPHRPDIILDPPDTVHITKSANAPVVKDSVPQDIIDSCKKLLADSNTPEEMRPALISAVTRLSSRK